MMKAIFGSEVRVGDTIDLGRNLKGKVIEYLGDDSSGRRLRLDVGHVSVHSGGIVGLVHRPWPEGKTAAEMREAVVFAAYRVGAVYNEHTTYDHLTDLDSVIMILRKAIEVYELGKPPEKAKE